MVVIVALTLLSSANFRSAADSAIHSPDGSTSCLRAPSQPTVSAAGPLCRSPMLSVTAPLSAGCVKERSSALADDGVGTAGAAGAAVALGATRPNASRASTANDPR